jgi:hypothetical protein
MVPSRRRPKDTARVKTARRASRLAEEKGFEPLVALRQRWFSNPSSLPAPRCTELQIRKVDDLEDAPGGTEPHGDQPRDHDQDQETKTRRPTLAALASDVLVAVANGLPRSLAASEEMARAILAAPEIKAARVVLDLLADGSPFALVRAVELAEGLLQRVEHGGMLSAGE